MRGRADPSLPHQLALNFYLTSVKFVGQTWFCNGAPKVAAARQVTVEPARRETVMETVARRIEGLIRSGELRTGSRLPPEPKLAAMLGVSRSSLREALKGLMFLGLIKARPGYGTHIHSSLARVVSRHFQWMLLLHEIKYLELFELRRIVEPTVASLAAQRATREDIEEMEAAIRGMKNNFEHPAQYMAAEIAFHEAVAQASKNVAVQTLLRMMYGALAEGRRRTLPLIEDFESNFRRHDRILRLITRRDPAGARKAVLADLQYAESLLRKDLAEQDRFRDNLGKSLVAFDSKSKLRKVRRMKLTK
jgi:GntR family transcriptional repressor for pyruvate dehydrogenase complex